MPRRVSSRDKREDRTQARHLTAKVELRAWVQGQIGLPVSHDSVVGFNEAKASEDVRASRHGRDTARIEELNRANMREARKALMPNVSLFD